MDSRKIHVSLFVLVAMSLCLMGEISSQDVKENLLYVMVYSQTRLIGQPLSIGPACYDLTSQAACEYISGCEWTAQENCRFMPSSSPETVTMQGYCSGSQVLVKQCIAGYNPDIGKWMCINTCRPDYTGEAGKFSCNETDGRVMTWDTNTCTISADLVAKGSDLQAAQFPILSFLFDAIERGNLVIFTLAIAISFAIGLYLSEVISKPKKSWKKYIKKNAEKVRKKSEKTRKHRS